MFPEDISGTSGIQQCLCSVLPAVCRCLPQGGAAAIAPSPKVRACHSACDCHCHGDTRCSLHPPLPEQLSRKFGWDRSHIRKDPASLAKGSAVVLQIIYSVSSGASPEQLPNRAGVQEIFSTAAVMRLWNIQNGIVLHLCFKN